MQASIFTRIINGEIPCHKVYEDEYVLAFMDINPVQPGHVLVVSKAQVDHIWDLPTEDYTALLSATQLIAQKMREVLNPARVGMQIIGIDVPHAHIHLIPFDTLDQFRRVPPKSIEPDHAELADMAAKLRLN